MILRLPSLFFLAVALLLFTRTLPAVAMDREGGAEKVNALDLLDSRVSYRADYSFTGDKGTYQGKLVSAHGMQRRDVHMAKGDQVYILRRDRDQALVIYPSRKWYIALGLRALGDLMGGVEHLQLERERGFADRVDGVAVTRSVVRGESAAQAGSGSFEGTAWLTQDGILMRLEGQLHADGKTTPVYMELRHLKIGPVSAKSFELPDGYHGLDLSKVNLKGLTKSVDGLGALMGGGK